MQKQPSSEDGFPAQVCFAGQGGILKNLDSALDEILGCS